MAVRIVPVPVIVVFVVRITVAQPVPGRAVMVMHAVARITVIAIYQDDRKAVGARVSAEPEAGNRQCGGCYRLQSGSHRLALL
jgi:hypothetical protein